jgi:hypothetical protein
LRMRLDSPAADAAAARCRETPWLSLAQSPTGDGKSLLIRTE